MNQLLAFVGFAFVGTVSPGPNNTVLWASGMRFGLRRTIPHVVGTAIGMALLVLGVAAGIDVLIRAVPASEVVLKVVGSVYLLSVAFLILGTGGVGRTEVSQPFGIRQAIVFQFLNPKAWVFAIAAVGTFLPQDLPRAVGIGYLTGLVVAIVLASSTVWAAGGVALGRIVQQERSRRVVSVALALLLVASVALIWIEP